MTAPTPGPIVDPSLLRAGEPLTPETVGLLVKGDVLRGIWDGSIWFFDRLTISPRRLVVRRDPANASVEARDETDAFAFVARPGVWMDWTGGPNPVPGMVVEWTIRTVTGVYSGPSEAAPWQHLSQWSIPLPAVSERAPEATPADVSASAPDGGLREALGQAYRFITQPRRMTQTEATYSTADYNHLTTAIRVALGMEEATK